MLKTILFCLSFPILSFPILSHSSGMARIDYADQNVHERLLFGDSWTGDYMIGFINKDWNVVRFQLCRAKKGCELLGGRELKKDELAGLTEILLRDLAALNERVEMDVIKKTGGIYGRNFFARYFNGTQDLHAIRAVISELERDTLANWVLVRREFGAMPSFATAHLFNTVAAVFDERLKEPYSPASPQPQKKMKSGTPIALLEHQLEHKGL